MFVSTSSGVREHAKSVWLAVHPKGLVARAGTWRLGDDDLRALGVDPSDGYRVGVLDGDTDVVAVPVAGRVEAPYELQGLRALAALVDGDAFAMIGRAMHTCDWLTTSRFCGRCGTRTTPSATDRCMVCPSCALHTYPRISPAIITLVRKGDLALLASNAKFPGVFYSTLAGFADVGESLEETVVREVREEVGVEVKNIRYFGSQPWPFPNSLMVGFTAEWASGEIVVDQTEIADAKWFRADALPAIPPPLSIARQLIDAWVREIVG